MSRQKICIFFCMWTQLPWPMLTATTHRHNFSRSERLITSLKFWQIFNRLWNDFVSSNCQNRWLRWLTLAGWQLKDSTFFLLHSSCFKTTATTLCCCWINDENEKKECKTVKRYFTISLGSFFLSLKSIINSFGAGHCQTTTTNAKTTLLARSSCWCAVCWLLSLFKIIPNWIRFELKMLIVSLSSSAKWYRVGCVIYGNFISHFPLACNGRTLMRRCGELSGRRWLAIRGVKNKLENVRVICFLLS